MRRNKYQHFHYTIDAHSVSNAMGYILIIFDFNFRGIKVRTINPMEEIYPDSKDL